MYEGLSGFFDAEEFGHFFVQEPFAGAVGLDPIAVDDELRDGPPAGVGEDFRGGTGIFLDVNFFEWNMVALKESLGFAAVGAPESGINRQFHPGVLVSHPAKIKPPAVAGGWT
jgi:hypothetical protein